MKLSRIAPRGDPPLRTVAEIAAILGIATSQLMWALKREGAPQPIHRGRGHKIKHVWYEPVSTIKWWKAYARDDPAAKRREYQRQYAAQRRAAKQECAP